ncbi:MAG: hypothetical protein EBR82_64985, partial [Caulobacteraceae bacterium]|nr:hypothetical protein [Caulobacteraceae bacterium]
TKAAAREVLDVLGPVVATNAGEEAASQLGQNAVAKGVYDPNRNLAEGVGAAALGGAFGGLVMGAPAAASSALSAGFAARMQAGQGPTRTDAGRQGPTTPQSAPASPATEPAVSPTMPQDAADPATDPEAVDPADAAAVARVDGLLAILEDESRVGTPEYEAARAELDSIGADAVASPIPVGAPSADQAAQPEQVPADPTSSVLRDLGIDPAEFAQRVERARVEQFRANPQQAYLDGQITREQLVAFLEDRVAADPGEQLRREAEARATGPTRADRPMRRVDRPARQTPPTVTVNPETASGFNPSTVSNGSPRFVDRLGPFPRVPTAEPGSSQAAAPDSRTGATAPPASASASAPPAAAAPASAREPAASSRTSPAPAASVGEGSVQPVRGSSPSPQFTRSPMPEARVAIAWDQDAGQYVAYDEDTGEAIDTGDDATELGQRMHQEGAVVRFEEDLSPDLTKMVNPPEKPDSSNSQGTLTSSPQPQGQAAAQPQTQEPKNGEEEGQGRSQGLLKTGTAAPVPETGAGAVGADYASMNASQLIAAAKAKGVDHRGGKAKVLARLQGEQAKASRKPADERIASTFERIAADAEARMEARAKKRGTRLYSTPLPNPRDVIDTAIWIAAKVARAGAKSYGAIRRIINESLKERPGTKRRAAQIARETMAILRESRNPDKSYNLDKFEAAVGARQAKQTTTA